MLCDSGAVDKEVDCQAKGHLQVWFKPHHEQVFNQAKKLWRLSPQGLPLGFELTKPVGISKPGFNNFLKCFKYTKYNGEYRSHSQATVAQSIRGSLTKPRVSYWWGSNPTVGNFSTRQKNFEY